MMHSMVVDVDKLDETLRNLRDDVVLAAVVNAWHRPMQEKGKPQQDTVASSVRLILQRIRE
jgi:hypothetical protein